MSLKKKDFEKKKVNRGIGTDDTQYIKQSSWIMDEIDNSGW